MKKVVIFCFSRAVGVTLAAQIGRFFGKAVLVDTQCVQDPVRLDPGNVLAILTGEQVHDHPTVVALVDAGMECLTARRAIDYNGIKGLLELPRGTEVLLVNDYRPNAVDAIDDLRRIGLDHLAYHPYYPGIPSHPELAVAVTPGESRLVPACVRRIIDIGTRQMDITTIMEVVQRLGMMEQLGHSISSQHLREITRLLREIDQAGQKVANMRDTLQVLADYAPNGILYTDLDGRILLGNQTLGRVLRMDPGSMVNRRLAEVLPELANVPEGPEAPALVSLGGQETMVWQQPVLRGRDAVGRILVFEPSRAIQALEQELRRKARLSEHVARYAFPDIISGSAVMGQAIAYAKRLAVSDSTILIEGASGTGKELFAQAIHNYSNRRQGPFVPVNFAAFPMTLLESELFGYEEGAFTGARKGGRRGLFEEAHGGTLFLDEIGDAPLEFQVRLLRVLQERLVRPVGGRKEIPIDVRVIAASHRDLAREVQEGRFREDLYYRLSVLPLRMPSLRERGGDIPLLIDQFVRRFGHGRISRAEEVMTAATLALLCRYPWPGNVRQLQNVIEFLMTIREEPRLLEPAHLPEYLRAGLPPETPGSAGGAEQDAAWVLAKVLDADNIGRRMLAKLAARERPHLTEGAIRGILVRAAAAGWIDSRPGRKGSLVTARGRALAGKWATGGLTG
jgi:transcriptional regulator with PAS, ATPase and Fis domain